MPVLKPPRGAQLNRSHPLARNLVGAWLMNEGTGDSVWDASGNGNHGTLTNMDPATDWVAGDDGWILELDGSDDYVVTAAPIIKTEAWTYIVCAQNDTPSETDGRERVLSSGNTPDWAVELGVYDSQMTYYLKFADSSSLGWVSAGACDTDWHVWSFVYDGTLHVYRDGASTHTSSAVNKSVNPYSDRIGYADVPKPVNAWDGSIGWAMSFDQALSASAIRTLITLSGQGFAPLFEPTLPGWMYAAGGAVPIAAIADYYRRMRSG